MSELQSWFTVLSGRGRVGGAILLALGVTLVGAAVVLAGGLDDSGAFGQRSGPGVMGGVIALGVIGLALVGFGGGSLFGAQARVARAMAEHREPKVEPREHPRAVAQTMAIPFWICSDCKVVEPGFSGCCVRCGRTVGYVQVGGEDERSVAVSSLTA